MQRLSSRQVEKLIEFVENNKMLYDRSHTLYTKHANKEAAWNEIANILNADLIDCKKAWKSLRDQYCKNLKTRIGSEDQDSVTKYKYYDRLQFLNEYLDIKPTSFNFGSELIKSEDVDSSDDDTQYSSPVTVKLDSKKYKYDNEIVKDFGDGIADHDGIDNFFLSLSYLVKKLNLTPSQLARLQCRIMNAAIEELENLSE